MRNARNAWMYHASRNQLAVEALEARRVLSTNSYAELFAPADDADIQLSGWESRTLTTLGSSASFEAAPAQASLGLQVEETSESSALGGFNIVINAGLTLAANQAALDAFERGAQQWEAYISDPITVTIDADLANLGSSSIIGQASSVILFGSYNQLRNAMVADADSDDGVVSFLPTAGLFDASLPAGIGLSGSLTANKSVMKALGFNTVDATFGAKDATITFNSQFSFDYDNSDGVTPGTIDFETVAAHEIGHALGFTSIVDTVDSYLDNGTTGNVSPRALDLFRFASGSSPSNTAEFATFDRDYNTGGNSVLSDTTDEWRFSTGVATGDGRQASHWKDNGYTGVLIGIMDPTLSYGQTTDISTADLRALDLIGYDIVIPAGNAPPVLDPISNQSIDEGSLLSFTATASDPDIGDQLTFSLGPGAPAGASIHPTSGVFSWTPSDNTGSPFSVEIVVSDDGSPIESDSQTFSITVNNVAPSAAISGTTDIFRGEEVTFTLTASDPSSADQAGLFDFEIDWDGNGTVDETIANVSSGSTVTHTFTTVSTNNIQVRATDKDGGTGGFSQTPISVSPYVLRGDGFGNTDLIWGGTPGLDAVYVFGPPSDLNLFVQIENLSVINQITSLGAAVSGKVVLHGYDSSDVLVGQFLLGNVMEIHGGDGDDVIVGGLLGDFLYGDGGNDTIIGGTQSIDGNDLISGGEGRDTLFGHLGADILSGDGGEDLLISDQFSFTNVPAAVQQIANEWKSARPYAERVSNILGVTSTGVNGSWTLTPNSTIFDDGAQDTLIGGIGATDWFFYDFDEDLLGDTIESGEEETDSDP